MKINCSSSVFMCIFQHVTGWYIHTQTHTPTHAQIHIFLEQLWLRRKSRSSRFDSLAAYCQRQKQTKTCKWRLTAVVVCVCVCGRMCELSEKILWEWIHMTGLCQSDAAYGVCVYKSVIAIWGSSRDSFRVGDSYLGCNIKRSLTFVQVMILHRRQW